MPVLVGGAAVALVTFADTSVLSRTYAARLRTPVDPNQEMVGLGLANLAAGFFQGFPVSSSSSAHGGGGGIRLQDPADRRGRRAGHCVAAALLAEPAAAHAHRGAGCRGDRLGHRHRSKSPKCGASIASSAGNSGCRWCASPAWRCSGRFRESLIAILIAVIEFLWDGWRPHCAVLGRVRGVRGYHDIEALPAGTSASPDWCCFAGMRRCSSPTPSSSRIASLTLWRVHRRRCAGW